MRSCETTLRFNPAASTEAVVVLGEWNGFAAEPMEGGALTKKLEARDYGYRFQIGKAAPIFDPNQGARRWVNDTEHSRLRVPDCNLPALEVTKWMDGAFTAQAQRGAKGTALKAPVVTLDGKEISADWNASTGALSVTPGALDDGKHRYVVTLADTAGKEAERLYLPFWKEPAPFAWDDALLYFAFTDRFKNGDLANDAPTANVDPQANYQGGDFRGVTQKIEDGYFDRLGVRAIWLSPLDANPDKAYPGSFGKQYTGYHGYWPSKAREVQPRFGNLLDLQDLTRTAHAHGIRVIADLVLNHTHEDHPYFAQHKLDGWYNVAGSCVCADSNCGYDARRLDCWFTSYLPDFNWRNAAQNDQLVADALWWLEQADLDGFRLDAVKHLDHAGGRNVAAAVNAIANRTGIDFYLVGETFTGSDGRAQIAEYVSPQELDGQFDFPLYWPIIDAFAKGGSLKGVDAAVLANEAFYSPAVLNSPFLGNHDVTRFISVAANQIDADPGAQAWTNRPPDQVTADLPFDRARWAFTFLLTQRGVPLIYYGDEIGLPGTGDPDNRRLMKFDAALSAREQGLLAFVQKLGAARKASKGLRSAARKTIAIEDDFYAFSRGDGADAAYVAINRGGAPRTIAATGKFREVISGAVTTTLSVPAGGSAVWIPEP